MSTKALFLEDAYQQTCTATVLAVEEAAVVLDQTVFYAAGGGQLGDTGTLTWQEGTAEVVDTVKGAAPGEIRHILAENTAQPKPGDTVSVQLNWTRRLAHMRMHTALHLLSVVIPLPVTGGSIGAKKSRLDFHMPEPPEDKQALEDSLNQLIAQDYAISAEWITDAELEANPGLVKTMRVKPPVGQGHVRLVRIGEGSETVDLQPCGGTHVMKTGEIGAMRLGKIEKKGKQNRRVAIHFA